MLTHDDRLLRLEILFGLKSAMDEMLNQDRIDQLHERGMSIWAARDQVIKEYFNEKESKQ